MGNNVLFGKTATKYNGSKAQRLAHPDLRWEESEQTNVGLDFSFLDSALTFSVDYYEKNTNGMIIEMPIPSYVGETKPQDPAHRGYRDCPSIFCRARQNLYRAWYPE